MRAVRQFFRVMLAVMMSLILLPLLIPYGLLELVKRQVRNPTVGFKRLPKGRESASLQMLVEETGFRAVTREEDYGLMGVDPRFRICQSGTIPGKQLLKTGDDDFDRVVELCTQIPYEWDPEMGPIAVVRDGEVRRYRNWSGGPVAELELLSRLDHSCRALLMAHVVDGGVEDGLVYGSEPSARWVQLCQVLSQKPSDSLEDRLFRLVEEDEKCEVRCVVLTRWLAVLDDESAHQLVTPFERVVRHFLGGVTPARVKEAAYDALEAEASPQSVAALYWLERHGDASCMTLIARFRQEQPEGSLLKTLAREVLANLEEQFGAVQAGGVSMIEQGMLPGALSSDFHQGGQVSEVAEGREPNDEASAQHRKRLARKALRDG